MTDQILRIAVIGNGGGGKTTLSRALAKKYQLKLIHVDSIQYLTGMQVRNTEETRAILNKIAEESNWVIDGFGPLDVMEKRFQIADKIVFVDFPLWRHYWWCTKRQLKSIWFCREELPEGCNEATFTYTLKLFRIIWRVHTQIKPQLIAIFKRNEIQTKVVTIADLKNWRKVFESGL